MRQLFVDDSAHPNGNLAGQKWIQQVDNAKKAKDEKEDGHGQKGDANPCVGPRWIGE